MASMVLEPGAGTVRCSADFSPCRRWRYRLTRRWGEGLFLNVIGLNPSTADEVSDDPTIRRCLGYARSWGFGGLAVTNLFAFRSTDSAALRKIDDPVGPRNDAALIREASSASMVLAAWGVGGGLGCRGATVRQLLGDGRLYCLGTTRRGEPRHPLYLPGAAKPVRFDA